MRELSTKYLRLLKRPVLFVLGLLMLILVSIPGTAAAKKTTIDKIAIQGNPLTVQFFVSGKGPVKVIKIEERELLVALKNATLSPGFKVLGRKNPAIDDISIETLDNDVVAVVVTSRLPFGYISSGFNKAGSSFSINLEKPRAPEPSPPKSVEKISVQKTKPTPPAQEISKQITQKISKEEKKAVPEPVPKPRATSKPESKVVPPPKDKKFVKDLTPPVYLPPKRVKGDFKGDISDLYRVVERLGCELKQIENAILLIKKQKYKESFDLLDQYVSQENFSCLEQVYYLRAYVYYKSISEEDYALLLTAEKMFQDALVSFPKSEYVSFAYTSIAMINMALKNNSAAEGYLNIVKQGYPQYPGMPEVNYFLAEIYNAKGYIDKALGYYKLVFESPIDNNYILDAGVGYGKALFKKRQYFDALSIFNYVVKSNAKKVYESPELLLNMANANFELGLSTPARQNFMRVLNLFPEIQDRDVVLSNVGDAYGMENNSAKAIKIYELVRQMFPDSQGYVNASIGIARYMKTDSEKIDIYEMIKQKFPENTYARIAMMRLAEIYQKNGEYNKCITEIEDLLSTHPRGLRYEAVKLMQQAYEALFKQQLKADEYTSILNRYELEHTKLDKMGSRQISFHVGMAYLKANLYEQGFNHLINAYKQYKRSTRSPELLFGLGVAMDESGRDDDALKLFGAFSKRFPKNKNRVAALTRMGEIYLEKNRYKQSAEKFKRAYALSVNHLEKGKILIQHSNISEKQKDLKTASKLRIRAVKDFAAAPGTNYDILTDAYKTLGNTYLGLESYVQAADAFSKALSFSTGNRAKANLGFLLGDAYQKGNIIKKAKEAFEQVAGNNDSVWARLARQRLTTLELAEIVINS
ncbi:MAG: tetratricopeptide repeat protein [Desulfobacteraceae bacterium]|nr:tetratricopeptide repeat protein [Desulfobacteraceae bacterium]